MSRRLRTIDDARQSLANRLQKRSVVMPNGCIEWLGHKTHGYGYVNFWDGERGTPIRAHRAAYALQHDLTLPFDGVVMHTCDNPACIRPAHLRLGTQADNMADKKAKRRNQFGSRCTYAKLNEAQVGAIRQDTRPQDEIAAHYGITQQTVSDICRRRIWKHVA